MRVRLFTLLSVSVMFLVAFAPAVFAQMEEGEDRGERDDRDGRDGDDVSCLQVQNAFGGQDQYANANAQYGGQGGETVAEVAQELGISQEQILNCIGVEVQSSDDDRGDVADPDDIIPGTTAEGDLPNTGGAPLPATIFALALLVASVALLGAGVRRGP